MRIAARMTLERSSADGGRAATGTIPSPVMRALGYDGIDVIVGTISENGFMAETAGDFPPHAFVRLKLPCVGSVYARIVSADRGRVAGEFVTPLSPARLRRMPGLSSLKSKSGLAVELPPQ